MSEGLRFYWYQGVDALLKGDEALAQDIWMSAMLECRVDDVQERTAELVEVLEDTAIESLQAGNWAGARKCYEMALEIDQSFENLILKKILFWQEIYTQHCENRGYEFKTDWFSGNIPIWNQVLKKFMGSPNLSFVEVGSWQGRATCWLLDNVLTDSSSTIICIDTFQGSVEHESMGLGEDVKSLESVFDYNIQRTGRADQVKKLVGFSQDWLRQLPLNSFDFYYVDGSHIASDVMEDVVLGWGLLKEEGIIIFDDYGWGAYQDQPTMHPKLAVDSFLEVFKDRVRVICKSYQVIVEKVV
ncbi:class I SAM-dependent methyltransferase [Synechocystis salina]|uniref:Class I SAM-dependent methyltransferase n=1 Tax=Synechocystis salina LEGE 00031 TaxID=1828736 RepID=A0ABR9VUJ2_9SYNC|nr:class I SAM-dependent methyltransferase [Synechocystis salina]MBE9241095.1 class I SAM-dependent methyltransferase [Synechocystis salina LEGE 00041]MBE9254553.1 class I SAM-dependent methyltransferase [Synechocystis salina LEGE 00031]